MKNKIFILLCFISFNFHAFSPQEYIFYQRNYVRKNIKQWIQLIDEKADKILTSDTINHKDCAAYVSEVNTFFFIKTPENRSRVLNLMEMLGFWEGTINFTISSNKRNKNKFI